MIDTQKYAKQLTEIFKLLKDLHVPDEKIFEEILNAWVYGIKATNEGIKFRDSEAKKKTGTYVYEFWYNGNGESLHWSNDDSVMYKFVFLRKKRKEWEKLHKDNKDPEFTFDIVNDWGIRKVEILN